MTKIFNKVPYLFLITIIVLLIAYSCKKEETISDSSSIKLGFSSDSIVFDTVFTSIGSATRQIRVYNTSDSKVKISNITLGMGGQSSFRINVDGESGSNFNNIELSGGDSLYIFARVTIDPQNQNNPYVVEDDIHFLTNGNDQSVKLVAWGKDANYIVADTYIEGLPPFSIVADSLETITWTNDKPYVVYGYAVIDSYGKLIIEEGTNIYFHEGAGLWAYVDGTLNVNGTIDNQVVFQGDRLEEFYDDVPGQWDRIWLMEGRAGFDHIIQNAIIRNGFIGLQTESFTRFTENSLQLHNVTIENMNGIGLFSRIYNVVASNLVVSNCGAYNLALTGGGYYRFAQSTIAAYWPYSVRNTPAVFINNFLIDSLDNPIPFPINFNFDNSILYGLNTEEFETELDGGADSLYYFKSSIIKTNIDVSDPIFFENVIVNEDPLFVDVETNDYRIDTLSPAIGKADLSIASAFPRDILDNSRLPVPDIGAYQFVPGQTGGENGTSSMYISPTKIRNILKKGYYPPIK